MGTLGWCLLGVFVLFIAGVVIALESLGIFATYSIRLKRLTAIQQRDENLVPKAFEGIPLVVYINMDKSTTRREWMERQTEILKARETEIKRVRGVKYNAAARPLGHASALSKNERGCMQAHFDAMKYALDANVPYALILEDDASFHFSKVWPESLKSILARAPIGWDTIRLFGFESEQYLNHKPGVQFKKPKGYIGSMVAYFVSREGLKKIQAATNDVPCTYRNNNQPLDVGMINSFNKRLNNYILSKMYVTLLTNQPSNIQPAVGVRWQWRRLDEALRKHVYRDEWMPVHQLDYEL